jgi:hypothetical protein
MRISRQGYEGRTDRIRDLRRGPGKRAVSFRGPYSYRQRTEAVAALSSIGEVRHVGHAGDRGVFRRPRYRNTAGHWAQRQIAVDLVFSGSRVWQAPASQRHGEIILPIFVGRGAPSVFQVRAHPCTCDEQSGASVGGGALVAVRHAGHALEDAVPSNQCVE